MLEQSTFDALCSVDGRISALSAVDGSSQVICTTELQLDQLCHSDKMDFFQLPGLSVCLSVCLSVRFCMSHCLGSCGGYKKEKSLNQTAV